MNILQKTVEVRAHTFKMATMTYVYIVIYMVLIQEGLTYRIPRYPAGDGTTQNILKIMQGRCDEYIQCIPPINSNIECDKEQRGRYNCTSIVMDFEGDITYTEPCTLNTNAFDNFVESSAQNLPPDSHLLWSGTKDIAHDYGLFTGRKTLEDSLIGFMMNDIAFCGSTEPPGFDFLQCPSCTDYNKTAAGIFWPKASAKFASLAKGKVEVVLSASNFGRPSYRNGSIFRDVEVPRMTKDVKELTAILVRDIGDNSTTSEHCGAGSLLELKNVMETRNIKFDCKENPPRIRLLQCAAKPSAKECQDLFSSDECSYTAYVVVIAVLAFILVIILLSAVCLYYFRRYKKQEGKTEPAI